MDTSVIVTEVEFQGTSGGAKLRALREARGRTQLWVEVEATLGTGYLQRVESGRVVQPGRGTIERVLDALDTRYSERREIEEAFGYLVPAPLPDERDRLWAKETCQRELDEVVFPAYSLDCTARLVAWNGYLPRLLGLAFNDRPPLSMIDRSMLVSWFDSSTLLGALVVEPESLLPAMLRALRFELRQYANEAWVASFISGLQSESPLFRSVWKSVAQESEPPRSTRARVPLRLNVPGAGRLEFRLASEPFTRDSRFRTIYLFPADQTTMHWCAKHAPARESTL